MGESFLHLDEALRNTKNKTVGVKQTGRALEKGQVKRLYIAQDTEPHILRPVLEWCSEHEVEQVRVPTMKELGHACGIAVGTAVAAVLK